MEKLTFDLLSSIRVETLENEIIRFEERIARNRKLIDQIKQGYKDEKYTAGVGVPHSAFRLFDDQGRRLSKVTSKLQQNP